MLTHLSVTNPVQLLANAASINFGLRIAAIQFVLTRSHLFPDQR